jgi:riboflavin biosynthesis pyrimidine reductase
VRAGRGPVDLEVALARIPQLVPTARFVQVEGGPRLNGALLESGCLDELDLTIAPALVGGPSGRIVAGAGETWRPLQLVHVLTDDEGYLFTRWTRPG